MAERLKPVPEQDLWRIEYLSKLLESRDEDHHLMLDTTDITDLIDSLCIN